MKFKSPCKCGSGRRRHSMKGGKSIFKRLGIQKAMSRFMKRKDVKKLGRKASKKLLKKLNRAVDKA